MAKQNTCDTIIKDKILQDQTDNVPPPCKNAFFTVKFYFHFCFHSFLVHSVHVGNDCFVTFKFIQSVFVPVGFF